MGRPPDEKPAFGYFWFSDYEGGTRIRYFRRLAEEKGLDYLRAEGVWFVFWRRCIHSPKPGYPYQPNGKRMTTECWASEWRVPRCDALVWIECLLSAGCAKRQQGGLLYLPNPAKSLCPKHLRKYGFVLTDADSGGVLDAKTIPEPFPGPVRSDPIRSDPIRSDPEDKGTPLPPNADRLKQLVELIWIPVPSMVDEKLRVWRSLDGKGQPTYPDEWIIAALENAPADKQKKINYIGGILRGYAQDGGPPERGKDRKPSRSRTDPSDYDGVGKEIQT